MWWVRSARKKKKENYFSFAISHVSAVKTGNSVLWDVFFENQHNHRISRLLDKSSTVFAGTIFRQQDFPFQRQDETTLKQSWNLFNARIYKYFIRLNSSSEPEPEESSLKKLGKSSESWNNYFLCSSHETLWNINRRKIHIKLQFKLLGG